ncbi:MAG TPA: vitamin K epoxide reductase family protein [Longimicrobiales bacterium]|nr:vitamin K epoxide reductase family protein [Longimicrobiales bacterium]
MLNRMGIALLALVGVLISAYMTAYKLGMLGSIVCGTGGCETVQNSPWSVFLGVPVPVIGLVGYGLLFAAALLGLQPRFEDDRRVPLVLVSGAFIGAAFSAYLTWLEVSVIHAWCRWCVVSAILAGLILLLALPEIGRLRTQTED